MNNNPDFSSSKVENPTFEYLIHQTIEVPDTNQIGEIDLWVPIPLNATNIMYPTVPTIQTADESLGCNLLYFEDVTCPFSLDISYSHDGKPRSPSLDVDFINSCEVVSEDFVGTLPKVLQARVNLARTAQDKVNLISKFLITNLKYEFPPTKSRDAMSVYNCMKSDCGGYHNLFVEFLRQNGIPAVVDFGFRFPSLESHAWAWWFDKKTGNWILEDLNDRKLGTFKDGKYSPRFSMTLGYGQKLTPPFPLEVLFLQEKLFWDRNYDKREKKIEVKSILSAENY